MVGLAGGFEQVTHALLDEPVVLFAIAAAVVDAADTELEFFAEEARAQVQINRVFGLDGLVEPGGAYAAFDAGGYAVVIHIVGEGEVFVAGFLF